MGIFLLVFNLFSINVALPQIQTGLLLSDVKLQILTIAYIVGYASLLIPLERLGAFFGSKQSYLSGIFLFTLASYSCILSSTFYELLFSRFFQGFCAALFIPQGIALISYIFTSHIELSRAYAIYAGIGGVAAVLGQFAGGLLPDLLSHTDSWKLIFLPVLPIGTACVTLGLFYLPLSPRQSSGLAVDLVGSLLLIADLFCLLVGLLMGAVYDWNRPVILLLSACIPLSLFLYQWQKYRLARMKSLLFNPYLFTFKNYLFGLWICLIYYSVHLSYFIIHTYFFQQEIGLSSSGTGIAFVAQGLGYLFGVLLCIQFVIVSHREMILLGLILMVGTLFLHQILMDVDFAKTFGLKALLFFYGVSTGIIIPSSLNYALASLPPKLMVQGSSLYIIVQQIASSIGVVLWVGSYLRIEKVELIPSQAYDLTILFMLLSIVLLFITFTIFKPKESLKY